MPARSRVTVRRARNQADLQRTSDGGLVLGTSAAAGVASALRQSREALVDIQGQLDALLAALRQPDGGPDEAAPDRLCNATRRAGSALAALSAAAGIR